MTDRERLSYVRNPCFLKEGMEMGRYISTVAVPPLYGRGTQSSEKIMCVCTCSPFIPLYMCVMKHTRQLSLACFVLSLRDSNTRRRLGSWARSHYVSHSDITSPFPPSGNKVYVRNRDVLIMLLDPQPALSQPLTMWACCVCVLINFYFPFL